MVGSAKGAFLVVDADVSVGSCAFYLGGGQETQQLSLARAPSHLDSPTP